MFSVAGPVVVRARCGRATDAMSSGPSLELSMRVTTVPLLLIIGAALANGGAPSIAAASPAPATPSPRGPYTAASSQVTLNGEITAIDQRSRAVTITGSDGAALPRAAGTHRSSASSRKWLR